MFVLALPAIAHAEMHWIKSDKIKPDKIDSAKIVYNGAVSLSLVAALISAIDEINADYPAVKSIKLYINIGGGSIQSGYLGYQAIKGSKIPIEVVNSGMTAPAATLLYCGAQKRATFLDSSFILHSAFIETTKGTSFRPNDAERMKKDIELGNKYFKSIYRSCTSLKPKNIENILLSNDNARYLRI